MKERHDSSPELRIVTLGRLIRRVQDPVAAGQTLLERTRLRLEQSRMVMQFSARNSSPASNDNAAEKL